MHFKLVAHPVVRSPFCIEIANSHDVFESLRAHRARVHPQSTADRPRDSFHPFQSGETRLFGGISDFFQFCAHAGSDLIAVDIDLIEIATARMNDYSQNPSIAHEQIRPAPDEKEGNILAATEANHLRKRRFVARLDPKLRGTANAQRRS